MTQNAISLAHGAIGYEGHSIISDLNLTFAEGASLALVGGNGSGKSTFLKTIAGLLPVICGDVRVLDDKPGKQTQRMAYHGQFHPHSFLLPLRSIDVVRMARFTHCGLLRRFTAEDENIVRESLEFMGAWDFASEPINMLSGGQRQRIFLAHTIARKADLILLDEPTAGLDVPGLGLYEQLICKFKKEGKTIVVATHSIKEASHCDQVLLLASRVVAFGPPTQVMTPQNILETFGLVAQLSGENLLIVDPGHEHRQ